MNNTKLLLSFALTTGSLIFCTANQDWTKNQTIYRKFLEDIVHNCDKYDKQTSHYHTGFLSMLTPAEAVTVLTHNEKDIINSLQHDFFNRMQERFLKQRTTFSIISK